MYQYIDMLVKEVNSKSDLMIQFLNGSQAQLPSVKFLVKGAPLSARWRFFASSKGGSADVFSYTAALQDYNGEFSCSHSRAST